MMVAARSVALPKPGGQKKALAQIVQKRRGHPCLSGAGHVNVEPPHPRHAVSLSPTAHELLANIRYGAQRIDARGGVLSAETGSFFRVIAVSPLQLSLLSRTPPEGDERAEERTVWMPILTRDALGCTARRQLAREPMLRILCCERYAGKIMALRHVNRSHSQDYTPPSSVACDLSDGIAALDGRSDWRETAGHSHSRDCPPPRPAPAIAPPSLPLLPRDSRDGTGSVRLIRYGR